MRAITVCLGEEADYRSSIAYIDPMRVWWHFISPGTSREEGACRGLNGCRLVIVLAGRVVVSSSN
jgi:hypothetical protein